MDVVVLVGRILFALIFIMSGSMNHIANRDQMTGYASQMGVPGARLAVPGSGLLILVGGLMVAFGIWGDLGALLLAAFLLPTAFYMHAFWKLEDPQQRGIEMAGFMKNVSMIGGALALFALFSSEKLGLTLTGPLFDR